jgi:hypothetical protein
MSQQVIADLQGAREIVRTRWQKGGLSNGTHFCAIGAVRQAIIGSPVITVITMGSPELGRTIRAEEALAAKLPAEYGNNIAEFNDAKATTHQDILDLFDKTLADLGGLA